MKKITSLARTALPLLTVSLLASCMSIPIESWTDPAVKDRDMGSVLIMGIGDSASTQRQYEALFVETLAAEGITATPGYAVVNNDKPLKKSQIVAKVKELGVDSVIITRVIDAKDRVRYVNTMVYPTHYGSYSGFHDWGMGMYTTPGYMENYTIIYLETNLFDAKSEGLVWSAQNRVTDDRSDTRNMKAVVKSVIKDLKKNGLL